MDVDECRLRFDRQVRARVREEPPAGSVVEWDGRVARTHFGTHGTVTHPDLPEDGLDELVWRQARAFADRGEPAEWKVYAHGTPVDLGDRLLSAGFTAGWTRQVLIADLAAVTLEGGLPRGVVIKENHKQLPDLVGATGPHRASLVELVADGPEPSGDLHTAAMMRDGRVLAAGWVELLEDTDFAAIGGMIAPEPAILSILCAWARQPPDLRLAGKTYVLAEADGALAALLTSAGFLPITDVTSFHLSPPEPPARERPVVHIGDVEYKRVWDRFDADFRFNPGVPSMPAIAEPQASVTWHLGVLLDGGEQAVDQLRRIVERGLRACTEPGEDLYWLDWNHPGCRFYPARVGGQGQPPWPGDAYPNGDYYIYITPDFRLGTFGHPWEHSLCVFGDSLLAEIEHDLTELLGTVMRRGGHNIGNVQHFGA
ncbi:DUF2716 domain-containing protein [Amycolatopsis cihanbeyliensis]|uniref:Uncharacterized protein DUF2716 n=1 Tax=Amycolatopsis cihanbeyliensis TaxID=1128664 RepID=A0A542CUH9_AMYCI|nr:DUF2716 domain-containing protein [Amycolatopsis cihanbeyliensis]TQI94482.1 uncharacterized protein DUF2716 [Amycolatopsis cihanbeyliensis]